MEKTKYRPTNGKWAPAIIAVVSATLGSGGGIALVFNTPLGQNIARPNPYTSIQAEERHRQTDARLKSLEEHDHEQDRRMDQLPPRELTESLLRLELRLGVLADNLERHEANHK